LPLVSVAVQVTVVVPIGNTEPDGGLQLAVAPEQLSAGTAVKVATAPAGQVGSLVMLAGQVIVGGCVSLTVTVNEQAEVLLLASVAVQVTVVVPFGNVAPEAGLQAGVPTPGQLSVAVAFEYVTTAVHRFVSVLCTTLAGQLIVGGVLSTTVTVA
jgi:hypothetical protein